MFFFVCGGGYLNFTSDLKSDFSAINQHATLLCVLIYESCMRYPCTVCSPYDIIFDEGWAREEKEIKKKLNRFLTPNREVEWERDVGKFILLFISLHHHECVSKYWGNFFSFLLLLHLSALASEGKEIIYFFNSYCTQSTFPSSPHKKKKRKKTRKVNEKFLGIEMSVNHCLMWHKGRFYAV